MQNEAEIDRRACVAIDRLVALHGKSFDVQAIRAFVALHAYRPEPARERGTNPNAKLTAANAKLTATVADLETRLQSATARATMAERECGELRQAQRLIESLSKGRAIVRKARRKRRKRKAATPNEARMQAKRDARARYMRQYRRKCPAVVMWGSNAALALGARSIARARMTQAYYADKTPQRPSLCRIWLACRSSVRPRLLARGDRRPLDSPNVPGSRQPPIF
jgi:hypothetical protein